MAEKKENSDGLNEGGELPSVDHDPLNKGAVIKISCLGRNKSGPAAGHLLDISKSRITHFSVFCIDKE